MFELSEKIALSDVKVPYVDLALQHSSILSEIMSAAQRVISSGQFVLGEELLLFEKDFAEFCGVRYAIGVNSGTDALTLVMRALGIGAGDEVITAPNSFITTASSIQLVGAKPVFVDVLGDYTINPKKIEAAITPRTKAIVPVHLTGRPCLMEAIKSIADQYQLAVIEDAAQAVAAKINNKAVGSLGNAGCFSFHPLKTLNACGDGGAITTDDQSLYEKILLLRNNGLRDRSTGVYWSNNSRLDTLQAAILSIKLKYIEQWSLSRIQHADYYREHLSVVPEIYIPEDSPEYKSVYHTFVVQAEQRDQLKDFLQKNGVGSAIHYGVPIHLQPCSQNLGYSLGDFPVTEHHSKKIISLPIHQDLTKDQLFKVVNTIKRFYKDS